MPSTRQPAHSAEVDAWFADLTHPLEEVMQLVRDTVLLAEPRVAECIKWKSPTFVYEGNIASINPRARRFVQLMFHRGADIPGDFARSLRTRVRTLSKTRRVRSFSRAHAGETGRVGESRRFGRRAFSGARPQGAPDRPCLADAYSTYEVRIAEKGEGVSAVEAVR